MSNGKRTAVAAALMCLPLVAATSAVAAERGFYLGAAAGQSSYDLSQEFFDDIVLDAFLANGAGIIDADSSLDDSDTGFGLLGGYRFNDYLAVEVSYLDLGELSYNANGLVTLPGVPGILPTNVDLTYSVKGPMASAIGILPVSDTWELYARGGILIAKSELDIGISADDAAVSDGASDDSAETVLGVGTAVHVGDRWSFRLEYQRVMDVGDDDVAEEDVDFFNLGVLVRL